MFECCTSLFCDMCRVSYTSTGKRMSDCISKQRFEIFLKENGWKVINKHHVCKDCVEHYGEKYLRKEFKNEVK